MAPVFLFKSTGMQPYSAQWGGMDSTNILSEHAGNRKKVLNVFFKMTIFIENGLKIDYFPKKSNFHDFRSGFTKSSHPKSKKAFL